MIFFGGASLRRAISEFMIHYHAEWNHQGLDNRLINPSQSVPSTEVRIGCSERLAAHSVITIERPRNTHRS
jgi:hypothetical protein